MLSIAWLIEWHWRAIRLSSDEIDEEEVTRVACDSHMDGGMEIHAAACVGWQSGTTNLVDRIIRGHIFFYRFMHAPTPHGDPAASPLTHSKANMSSYSKCPKRARIKGLNRRVRFGWFFRRGKFDGPETDWSFRIIFYYVACYFIIIYLILTFLITHLILPLVDLLLIRQFDSPKWSWCWFFFFKKTEQNKLGLDNFGQKPPDPNRFRPLWWPNQKHIIIFILYYIF